MNEKAKQTLHVNELEALEVVADADYYSGAQIAQAVGWASSLSPTYALPAQGCSTDIPVRRPTEIDSFPAHEESD